MSAACRLLALGLLSSAPGFAAQEVVPPRFPASRYEKMVGESPFSLATAAVAPVEKVPSVFEHLYVTGISRGKDRDGNNVDFVAIKSRADQSSFSLAGTEPLKEGPGEGIALVSINWSDEVGKGKVMVRKGEEQATLGFDEQVSKPSMAAMPPPGRGNGQQPMILPNPNGKPGDPNRVRVPGPNGAIPGAVNGAYLPQQQGGNRAGMPVIPRPTSVAPLPGQAGAVPGQPGGDTRRRIRTINPRP